MSRGPASANFNIRRISTTYAARPIIEGLAPYFCRLCAAPDSSALNSSSIGTMLAPQDYSGRGPRLGLPLTARSRITATLPRSAARS